MIYPSEFKEKISLFKRLKLRLGLRVYIGDDFIPKKTRIYLWKCATCKTYYLDYLRGYKEYITCPRCGK